MAYVPVKVSKIPKGLQKKCKIGRSVFGVAVLYTDPSASHICYNDKQGVEHRTRLSAFLKTRAVVQIIK